eukprot:CAMPEP_0119059618 /NCGR_PEP_ID=MMETSP1178-20130426/3721_1 /TAXON_ID=33656 /ORGANISM="unid sp, Strain CCMP2000" /LENGTH=206 /DNA_ID=CAMNT_0007040661 /DNA_START=12 /DNA_END=633 /DNA_ORIENTATION=-
MVLLRQLDSVGSFAVDAQAASSAVLRAGALSSAVLRAGAPAALLVLRGGASVGPIKAGPISIDLLLGPQGCVVLNAVAGILYSISLVGLDPNMPDPTMKYWEQEQTPATRAILQFFALTLVWINCFMLYAMVRLRADTRELLKFQSFGWFSILALLFHQANRWGFTAHQETLGIMLTLLGLSAYLGFVPSTGRSTLAAYWTLIGQA